MLEKRPSSQVLDPSSQILNCNSSLPFPRPSPPKSSPSCFGSCVAVGPGSLWVLGRCGSWVWALALGPGSLWVLILGPGSLWVLWFLAQGTLNAFRPAFQQLSTGLLNALEKP